MCSAWIDLADVGVHVPRAVGALAQAVDPRVAVDLGTGHAGADRVGVGDTGRIDMTLDRVVQRADEVLVLHEREQRLRLLRTDQLELHAEVAAAGLGHPQEVHADLGVGEHQPTGQVDAAVLAGDALELLVELDRVLLQLRHVRVAVERVHATGRVPRGAGGELLAFEQDDIGPSGAGEVVQDAAPDDATADHDDLGR